MRAIARIASLAVLVTIAAAPRLGAQVVTHTVLSAEGVKKALAGAEAEAVRNGWQVSIAVVDPAGNLLGFMKMDQASGGSIDIAQAKARTAARFRRPTKALEEVVAGGRAAIMTLPGIVTVEGGVPVVIDGKVVAAVGVSGVTSPQDGQIAAAGAVAAGGTPPAPPAR